MRCDSRPSPTVNPPRPAVRKARNACAAVPMHGRLSLDGRRSGRRCARPTHETLGSWTAVALEALRARGMRVRVAVRAVPRLDNLQHPGGVGGPSPPRRLARSRGAACCPPVDDCVPHRPLGSLSPPLASASHGTPRYHARARARRRPVLLTPVRHEVGAHTRAPWAPSCLLGGQWSWVVEV